MKMNSSISAMTDVNCGISGQRAKSRMDIHRPLRDMVVQTAADVNIKRVVCISMMRKKDAEKNKVMKINEQWEELKERSHSNIQSERGILKRQTRSIQTEGHFGDIKENENFRRFNYTVRQIRYIKNSCCMLLEEI